MGQPRFLGQISYVSALIFVLFSFAIPGKALCAEIASKAYVDGIVSGLQVKIPAGTPGDVVVYTDMAGVVDSVSVDKSVSDSGSNNLVTHGAVKTYVDDGLAGKQNVIVEFSTRAEAETYATANPGTLVMYPM